VLENQSFDAFVGGWTTRTIVNKLLARALELSRLANLKLIAVAATGVDNIDH